MKPVPRIMLAVATLAVLGSCATTEEVTFARNLVRAQRAGSKFYRRYDHIEKDVAYTGLSDSRLDVYSPPAGEGHPVFIFVHGGGWNSYGKRLFAPVAMRFVPNDMVVVIPEYTLHPDATYELMAAEIAAAVAWTFENVRGFRGDPDRVVLGGHSAGGHLSGLVAFDPQWLGAEGYTPADLCGWVGISGVYDLDAQMAFERAQGGAAPIMTEVMQGEPNFPRASPITYVSAETSREGPGEAWIIHGVQDETVPVSIGESLAIELLEAGVETHISLYREAGHSDFLFEALVDESAPVVGDITTAVRGCAE